MYMIYIIVVQYPTSVIATTSGSHSYKWSTVHLKLLLPFPVVVAITILMTLPLLMIFGLFHYCVLKHIFDAWCH